MNKLLLLSAGVVSILVGCFYFDQPCCASPTYKVPPHESASQSYNEAIALLDAGKDTYKAIALLTHSIADVPDAAAYHEALAFAYTDKAAFVYRAWLFRCMMSIQNKSSRQDQHSHVFYLKDDGSIFSETDSQAINEMAALFSSSKAEWTLALAAAKTDSDKARVHYEKAGADRIFAVIENDCTSVQKPEAASPGLNIYQDSAIEIGMANRLQPQNGLYWEAAGTIADRIASETAGSSPANTPYPPSHSYYIKSLALQPNNEALWLQIAQEDRDNPAAVQTDVSEAYRLDPKNEFVLLSYIDALYKTTHYNTGGLNDPSNGDKWKTLLASLDDNDAQVVKTVENMLVDAPTPVVYTLIIYDYPYPAALMHAAAKLNTTPIPNTDEMRLRNAARCVAGTARCLAMQGKADEATALLNGFTKGVATMLTPDHFTPDAMVTGKSLSGLFGDAIMGIAMSQQAKIADAYESKADAAIADKALADYTIAAQARKREARALTSKSGSAVLYAYY